jgi:hypothetical protein
MRQAVRRVARGVYICTCIIVDGLTMAAVLLLTLIWQGAL